LLRCVSSVCCCRCCFDIEDDSHVDEEETNDPLDDDDKNLLLALASCRRSCWQFKVDWDPKNGRRLMQHFLTIILDDDNDDMPDN
jgi:hypothetical protein